MLCQAISGYAPPTFMQQLKLSYRTCARSGAVHMEHLFRLFVYPLSICLFQRRAIQAHKNEVVEEMSVLLIYIHDRYFHPL